MDEDFERPSGRSKAMMLDVTIIPMVIAIASIALLLPVLATGASSINVDRLLALFLYGVALPAVPLLQSNATHLVVRHITPLIRHYVHVMQSLPLIGSMLRPNFSILKVLMLILLLLCCSQAMAVPVNHTRSAAGISGEAYGSDGRYGREDIGRLILIGHLVRLNAESEIIDIRWWFDACPSSDPTTCTTPWFPVQFRFDGSPVANGTYDPTSGTYRLGSHNRIDIQPRFQTKHAIEGSTTHSHNEIFYYPLDTYHFTTYIQAVDPEKNTTLEILDVSIIDATNNFVAGESLDLNTYTRQIDPATGHHCVVRTVQYTFQRSRYVKAYNAGLFLASWSLACVALYISSRACRVNHVSEALILFPATLVPILSALRTLWPGAPPFGILLDVSGLVPQMFIMAISFLAVVWRRTQ